MNSPSLQQYLDRLPHRPYCSDDLSTGLLIRAKAQAVLHRYIQHNQPQMQGWLVFDIDKKEAPAAAADAGLPAPSISVINRSNRHAHFLYGLATPVCKSDIARRHPLRYLASIEAAYRSALAADQGYSGLISKNPLHPDWDVLQGREQLYDLQELADYVDLSLYADKRRRLPSIGLGRNCNLFDSLRFFAYRKVAEYRAAGSYDRWLADLATRAEGYNSDFPRDQGGPLPLSEVRATVKSVGRWTWHNYRGRMTDAEFSARQAVRGKIGGKKAMLKRWGDTPDMPSLLWEND